MMQCISQQEPQTWIKYPGAEEGCSGREFVQRRIFMF